MNIVEEVEPTETMQRAVKDAHTTLECWRRGTVGENLKDGIQLILSLESNVDTLKVGTRSEDVVVPLQSPLIAAGIPGRRLEITHPIYEPEGVAYEVTKGSGSESCE